MLLNTKDTKSTKVGSLKNFVSFVSLVFESLRNYTMKPSPHTDNIDDAHASQLSFGRDVFLEPGSQRLAEEIASNCEHDRKRDQEETPKVGARPRHGKEGQRRRQKRGCCDIGAAPFVDGQSAFTGAQSLHGLIRGFLDVLFREIAHQEEAGRVGMSAHGLILEFAGKDVECCVFNRVISSGFEDQR